MRKIGICLAYPTDGDPQAYVKMLREIGFEVCFTGDNDTEIETALNAGFEMDNVHAPFSGINEIWNQGMSGDKMLEKLKHAVDTCARYGITKTVIHLSSGENSPHVNDIGASRFDKLVNHAVSKNVCLAFENQRKLANISYIFERYDKVPQVGFCWDVGHEACFTNGREYMPLFGHKMILLHLQDNYCVYNKDNHLLPFDGNIDMKKTAEYIKNSPYDGPVTLEVFKRPASVTSYDGYEDMTLRQYYERAYAAAVKFRDML